MLTAKNHILNTEDAFNMGSQIEYTNYVGEPGRWVA